MNARADLPHERLTVFGQFAGEPRDLLPAFRAARTGADLEPLLRRDDNYVAAYEQGDRVWVVNSFYSLQPYFYHLSAGLFKHGDTIHGLAQSGTFNFQWNPEAIADLMGLGHPIGDDTLAADVLPLPQGAVLQWDGRRLTVDKFAYEDFIEGDRRPASANQLLELFLSALQAGVGHRPIMTSSSGLDSRLNLAGLLHLGIQPELYVMGRHGAKDVEVTRAMAKAYGLQLNHVELEPQEYVDGAVEICRVTNGIKSVDNWHTYMLAKKSGYGHRDTVIVGNNGEHVRAMGFDYGVLALALDRLSRHDRYLVSGPLLAKFWKMKTHQLLRPDELKKCCDGLARYYGSPRQSDKLMSLMPRKSFVWRSDAFVLEQRRRMFQACGLKLMSLGFAPFSPFMSKRWIDVGWSADLSLRLGSAWHRQAVERLYPDLLRFPEEAEANGMLRHERPFTWLPGFNRIYRRPKAKSYADYGALLRRPDILALLRDYAGELEDVMPRELVARIADEQALTGKRGRLCATLTSMAVWRSVMRPRAGTSDATLSHKVDKTVD
ncbi:MAG: asparagine synthase [Myxococcaceae bacterium]|nr:asparagine synthase [Myxococcaceae bacterium]